VLERAVLLLLQLELRILEILYLDFARPEIDDSAVGVCHCCHLRWCW
jgi:hypothetical protein